MRPCRLYRMSRMVIGLGGVHCRPSARARWWLVPAAAAAPGMELQRSEHYQRASREYATASATVVMPPSGNIITRATHGQAVCLRPAESMTPRTGEAKSVIRSPADA